jgi:uncharacterized protein (DUF433 family)
MRIIETVRSSGGLYTIPEAAKYARMPTATLTYWLYGDRVHTALRRAQIDTDEGRYLTFLEFAEALAIRDLRANHHVSLPKIRQAIDEAKTTYKIDYPFANKKHRTYLIGKDLHITVTDELDLVQISGKGRGQKQMRPCLEQFMRDLEFDEKDTASAYTAYRWTPRKGKKEIIIRMNPAYCFGEPVVVGTGYRARTLWKAAVAEGSEKKAAENYDVDVDSVIAASRYCVEIEKAA